jgi:hypothetical protein
LCLPELWTDCATGENAANAAIVAPLRSRQQPKFFSEEIRASFKTILYGVLKSAAQQDIGEL